MQVSIYFVKDCSGRFPLDGIFRAEENFLWCFPISFSYLTQDNEKFRAENSTQ